MRIDPKTILLLSFLIIQASCSSVEIFKENTEIAPYKEYNSFVIINTEVDQPGFKDAILDDLIAKELQLKMEAMGLVYERENPELVIRYTSNEDLRQKEIMNNRYPMWGYRVWDPWMFNPMWRNNRYNTVTTSNYELVQLIVDIIDPEKDKMLMRLTAVSEASNSKDKTRKLLKSVEKIVVTYQEHLSNSADNDFIF
jgi:hypothetical protein